jgi:hypothetical protein
MNYSSNSETFLIASQPLDNQFLLLDKGYYNLRFGLEMPLKDREEHKTYHRNYYQTAEETEAEAEAVREYMVRYLIREWNSE